MTFLQIYLIGVFISLLFCIFSILFDINNSNKEEEDYIFTFSMLCIAFIFIALSYLGSIVVIGMIIREICDKTLFTIKYKSKKE